MTPIIPIEALLPNIPCKFQQMMANNRANMEKIGVWDFLLWVCDVDKAIQEQNVTRFVHTYHLKTKITTVGDAIMEFSTMTIATKKLVTISGAYASDYAKSFKDENSGDFWV